jgi:hypothetical protein
MVMADRGQNSDRESVRSRLHCGLARHLSGNAMAAKTTPQKAKRKNASKTSKANPPPAAASALSMVAQNLVNMVVVSAVSATVLLGLLAAKHF